MSQNPAILFEPKIFTDIFLAALACDVEVSGFAKINKDNDTYRVYGNPVIYNQFCSTTQTTFDSQAHHRWIQRIVTQGKGAELPKFRVWWHSHVYSEVYLSRTDRRTIDEVFANNFDWLLAVVVNKHMEIYVELNIFQPVRLPPIVIDEFCFSERFTAKDFERMLERRKLRISKIVSSRVTRIAERKNNED